MAHAAEAELKRVPGTREVQTLGGPGRALHVLVDADRLAAHGVSPLEVRNALRLEIARKVSKPQLGIGGKLPRRWLALVVGLAYGDG